MNILDRMEQSSFTTIIGLSAPRKWTPQEAWEWSPKCGYGGSFTTYDEEKQTTVPKLSRAESIELAKLMAARWRRWGRFIASLPDEAFPGHSPEEEG